MAYQLVEKPTGLTIVDEAGAAVSFDEAHQVINHLMNTYAHPAYVYLACRPTLPRMEYKIGYSGQVPEKRMSQLRYQIQDDRIFLLHTISCKSAQTALALEAKMHGWFDEQNLYGEWFNLASDDVQLILDVQSEEEATGKHFEYILGDLMQMDPDKVVDWILSLPEDDQSKIMKTVDEMLDKLDSVLFMYKRNQLRLPDF